MPNLLPSIREAMESFNDCPTFTELEVKLAETILAEAIDPMDLGAIKLSNPNAKWRAISSLQKAVRRGHAENAVMMARAFINSGEEKHLLARACTIALEDIAFANPELCAQVFYFASSVKVRKALGGWPTFLQLIARMASTGADRVPCELAVTAGYSPEDDEHKLWLHSRSHEEVVKLAFTGHWQDQQTATRLLAGNIKMNGEYLSDHRDMTSFRAVFDDCPMLIRYLAHRAAAGGGESAGLVSGMRLGWHLLYNHPDAEPVDMDKTFSPDAEVLRGVLIEALDMHTQEGKKAFRTALKMADAGAEFIEWVESLGGDPLAALGNGVFMVEGKRCVNRLSSMDIANVSHLSHLAQMGRCGLPKDELSNLHTRVSALLPAVNEARRMVLKNL